MPAQPTTRGRRTRGTLVPDPCEVAGFVERLGSTLTEAGFRRLPARVFACLLAREDGRMTAAELADTLRVSAGSVSGAVGYLGSIHLIHRERERGSRRDVYVVADDAWHDTMLGAGRIYEPFIRVLADGVDTVGGAGTRAGDRLALSVGFMEFLVEEMAGISARWEARQAQADPTP
ncbi:MAG: transcriptional regulator TrmB [Actinomycetota bacterium]|nr:transcriptional regulator TrmB [Actinomycetota bacterium]